MSKRLTIYERLKPEIKEALHSSENDKYSSDLKISDISSLYTFTNLELIRITAWDFKYGDNILISKDYE